MFNLPPSRRYIVSGLTGVTVLAGVSAFSAYAGAKPGAYRIGFKNDAGEVTFLRDFRTLTVLGALGLNLLPLVAEYAGGIPLAGGLLNRANGMIGEKYQDYAVLAGTVAAASLGATEALDMHETGQFMGLPVPQMVLNMFKGGADAAPQLADASADGAEVEMLGEAA